MPLFAVGKLDYCRGKRPDTDCILCEIVAHSGRVEELEVFRAEGIVVSVNLYPYTSGHLLLFPERHLEDPAALDAAEAAALHRMLVRSLAVLRRVYAPAGFNIGCNIGPAAGASIRHLHQHIVPRYPNELGFVDVIGGSRILVEDPLVCMEKLKKAFADPDG